MATVSARTSPGLPGFLSGPAVVADPGLDFQAPRPLRLDSPVQRNFEILRRIEFFQDAPAAEVLRLAELARVVSVPKGAPVDPGLAGGQVTIVAAGSARRSLPRGEGNYVLLGVVEAGEVVSEAAFCAASLTESVETVALTPLVLVQLPRTALQQVLDRCGLTASRFLAAAARRLGLLTEMLARLSGLEVSERFYLRLVELAWQKGKWKRQGLVIDHGLCQRELAASIGSSRESVNRQLAAWTNQGFLGGSPRSLVVLDPDGLSFAMPAEVRRSWPPRGAAPAATGQARSVVHLLARGCDIG